jgi:hypothetical protein
VDPFLKTLGLISPGLESFVIRLGFRADFVVRLRLDVGIGGGGIVAAGSSTTPWFAGTVIGKDRAVGVGVGNVSCIDISLEVCMWHNGLRSHFGTNTVAKPPFPLSVTVTSIQGVRGR